MLVVNKLVAQGRGLAPVLLRRAAALALDWDTRQKSRFDAVDSLGRRLGVFLPRGRVVRGGDVLVADDGSLIAVTALAQAVLVVSAGRHGSALDLARAAYHLGNRHVPLEVRADRLQLEPDHVLAELLARMGLQVEAAEAPFEPESGAYEAGPASPHAHAAHDHGDDHGHDHSQGNDHRHGPDCGHDHEHRPDHAGHGHAHTDDADR